MKYIMTMILPTACWFATGCSEPGHVEDSWYDSTADMTEKQDTYIQDQINAGVPEEEARANYDRDQWIKHTLDRPKVIREGDDLDYRLADPDNEDL